MTCTCRKSNCSQIPSIWDGQNSSFCYMCMLKNELFSDPEGPHRDSLETFWFFRICEDNTNAGRLLVPPLEMIVEIEVHGNIDGTGNLALGEDPPPPPMFVVVVAVSIISDVVDWVVCWLSPLLSLLLLLLLLMPLSWQDTERLEVWKMSGIAIGDEGVVAMDKTGSQSLSCRESVAKRHVSALKCTKDDAWWIDQRWIDKTNGIVGRFDGVNNKSKTIGVLLLVNVNAWYS